MKPDGRPLQLHPCSPVSPVIEGSTALVLVPGGDARYANASLPLVEYPVLGVPLPACDLRHLRLQVVRIHFFVSPLRVEQGGGRLCFLWDDYGEPPPSSHLFPCWMDIPEI